MPYAVYTKTLFALPLVVALLIGTPVGADNNSDFKNATPIILGGKTETKTTQKSEELTPEKVRTLKKLGNAIFDGTGSRTTSELKYEAGDKKLAGRTIAPTEPTAPVDPESNMPAETAEPKSTETKKSDTAKTKAGNFKIKCSVYFGNGKYVNGWLFGVKERSLQIEHKLHGNRFRQTLDLADLKTISVTSYDRKKIRSTRGGEMFEFIPNRIRITKRNGKSLEYNTLPQILKSFRFYSEDFGFARLYTYFADVQTKAGKWRNRSNGKAAHPNAVTKFVFTD